mmetsp:Transcript_5060/g.9893  ORF Transcript_5060/g.9893 Transcript_5060/m.9893 type:complete len:282 (-) Transcript_5060:256-1101(-)
MAKRHTRPNKRKHHKPSRKSPDILYDPASFFVLILSTSKQNVVDPSHKSHSTFNPSHKMSETKNSTMCGFKKLKCKISSIVTNDGSSSPPLTIRPPSHPIENSSVDNQGRETQAKLIKILKVFVPQGLEPGRTVKVRHMDGSLVQTDIPPRSKWIFQNCNGEPRPFFLVSVNPAGDIPISLAALSTLPESSQLPSSPRRNQNHPAKSRKKVHNPTDDIAISWTAPSTLPESSQLTSCQRRKQNSPAKSRKRVHFVEPQKQVCQCIPSRGVYEYMCPYHMQC